jgi:hypothetical protein
MLQTEAYLMIVNCDRTGHSLGEEVAARFSTLIGLV